MTTPTITTPIVSGETPQSQPWYGPIAREGVFTGDGRKFEPEALYWEDLPAPLRWAPEDFGGHDGARHVGWIETITRGADGAIDGTGSAFDQEFLDHLEKCGQIGISIDPDMAEFDIIIPPDAQPPDAVPEPGVPTPVLEEQQIFTKARIRAATCVDIPAFIDAVIKPGTDSPEADSGEVPSAAVVAGDGLFAATAPPTDASVPDIPRADIKYAGLALQAADTGRVLMLQRSLDDPEDPNAGLWEFPGGGLEDGEDPYEGAMREFAEEVGTPVPETADNGGAAYDLPPDAPEYRLHMMTVPAESDLDLLSYEVQNPDDPHGLNRESLAWWDPQHIQGDHIRPEVLDTMDTVGEAMTTPTKTPVPKSPAPPVVPKAPAPPGKMPPTDGALNDSDKKFLDALDTLLDEDEGTAMDFSPEVASLVKDLQAKVAELNPDPEDNAPTAMDVMTASAAPVAPPDEWFTPFDLDGATPLTVTADGRVFGHAATWDSCHRGNVASGKCLKPPSDPKAPFFQLGQIHTASGNTVDVGVVTVGGGHWTKNGAMTTLEHHDDVTAAAAVVVVQEDEWGIGIFGSITADATPQQVAALRRSPVSGAWRKEKGVRRLKGIHCVNDPGFPIPRGLVASATPNTFITYGRPEMKTPDPHSVDLRAAAQRLARSAGLDTQSLVASARASMADLDCDCDDEEPALVASIGGDTSLPIADYNTSWDGGEAAARIFEHFTDASGKVDATGVAKGFLWRDESKPEDKKEGYSLPFADIVNGELQIVPVGVQACAGGHGVGQLAGVSPQDVDAIKAKIVELYGKIKADNPDAPDNPYDKSAA